MSMYQNFCHACICLYNCEYISIYKLFESEAEIPDTEKHWNIDRDEYLNRVLEKLSTLF